MQIVIEIPEILYKAIISHHCRNRYKQRDLYDDFINAIEDGTPLPKGHGRLIDADALVYMEFNDAPTIIEADKEEIYE